MGWENQKKPAKGIIMESQDGLADFCAAGNVAFRETEPVGRVYTEREIYFE